MNICDLLAKSSLRVVSLAVLLAMASHGAVAEGKPKIAFLLKTMQEQRYQTDRRDFIAAVEKLGADVQFNSAGNDEERQLEEFDAALDASANVIVLQPVDTGTAGAMVAKANGRGVRVVGYDSMITNGPLDVMVMQELMGRRRSASRRVDCVAAEEEWQGRREYRVDHGPARRFQRTGHEQRGLRHACQEPWG